jgi:flagellar FliL protein
MTATAPTAERPQSVKPGDAAGDQPPKKSKKKLFIIIGVLVLLIGGFEAKSILLKPHYKPGQAVPNGKILPLDQLTFNVADGHLVQLSISLQLSKVAASKSINSDIPRFEDAAVTLVGSYKSATLISPQGRAAVKAQYLADVQKIAGTVDGAGQQINAVYFTGFVIQ